MKFEYHVEKVKLGGLVTPNLDEITSEWLDQFGSHGWELVQVLQLVSAGGGTTASQVYFYFKRPKP